MNLGKYFQSPLPAFIYSEKTALAAVVESSSHEAAFIRSHDRGSERFENSSVVEVPTVLTAVNTVCIGDCLQLLHGDSQAQV